MDGRKPNAYTEEIVREFYDSYDATIRNSINKWAKPVAKPSLEATLIRGLTTDILRPRFANSCMDPTLS